MIAVIFEAFPSPSETFLSRELDALRALGLDVCPFAWRAGEGAQLLPDASPLASRLARRVRGEAWWRDAGAKWARSRKQSNSKQSGEISHIHAAWASFPAAWALGAAREMGVPWSFSAHARDLWVEGGDLKGNLASAAFATACTRAGTERLRALSPRPQSVLYAPHGLPLRDWPLRSWRIHDLSIRPFQILSVGRLVPKKGLDTLLHALAEWWRAHPQPWQAQIVGDGPERARLEALSADLNLERRVRFSGAQSSEQVRAAMLQADVFVLPCRVTSDGDRDGLPNVLLEAAAIGVPLIVGDAGSVRDLCDDSQDARTAWLFPPQDAHALSALLREAWRGLRRPQNPWREAAERARTKVERDFDIERNILVLARALEQASGAGS